MLKFDQTKYKKALYEEEFTESNQLTSDNRIIQTQTKSCEIKI